MDRIRIAPPSYDELEKMLLEPVFSSALINKKLDGSAADIPLIRMYEFLKERTNL